MADEPSGLERRLAKTADWLVAEDHFLPDCETIRSIREAAAAIGDLRKAMARLLGDSPPTYERCRDDVGYRWVCVHCGEQPCTDDCPDRAARAALTSPGGDGS